MSEIECLIEAAKAGDEKQVRTLIAADPSLVRQRLPSGESPLMAALYRGHWQVVSTLVELDADVDVFAAAATGNLAALRSGLQEPGAANSFAYDGWTPLHLAAFFGRVDAARMVLDAGGLVTTISRNSLKNTPLHAATAAKHSPVAIMLLERGADPQIQDSGGSTPQRIAVENQLHDVLAAIARRS